MMALIDCPECGNRVSEKASACPTCGAPVATTEPPQRAATPYDTTEAVIRGRTLTEWAGQLRDLDYVRVLEAINSLACAQDAVRGTPAVASLTALLDAPLNTASNAMWALGHIGDASCVDAVLARIERARGKFDIHELTFIPKPCDDAHSACRPAFTIVGDVGAYEIERKQLAYLVSLGFWTLAKCQAQYAIPFIREFSTTDPFPPSAANNALRILGLPVKRITPSPAPPSRSTAVFALIVGTPLLMLAGAGVGLLLSYIFLYRSLMADTAPANLLTIAFALAGAAIGIRISLKLYHEAVQSESTGKRGDA